MASDRELKLRIRSVHSIGQITNAMKMVASSQIRRVEAQAVRGRPYASKLREVVQDLAQHLGQADHPLLQTREVKRVGVLCLGADNGLCGAYNSNIGRTAVKLLEGLPVKPSRLVVLGSKLERSLRRAGYEPTQVIEDWKAEDSLAQRLAEEMESWFLEGEVDEVWCVYTEAITMLQNEPMALRLLPLSALETTLNDYEANEERMTYTDVDNKYRKRERQELHGDYIFEPDAQTALNTIVPLYLRAVVMQYLLEAKTSELGSRLRAMTNATDNAEKLESELTLEYYRVRQNNITTEIIEISSGAEALKG